MILTHEKLSQAFDAGKLVISRIPSHRWRHYIEKGYNQSEVLARGIAEKMGISALSLARKNKNTISQIKLNRAARLDNLKGVFEVGELGHIQEGSVILLVDDVTTTGATLNQLALSIKNARPDLKVR